MNAGQSDAVNRGLQRPLSVVQGPPGTGKTTFLINLVLPPMENKKAQLRWTFQGRFATKSSTKIQQIYQKYKKQQGRRLGFVFLVDFLYFC